MDMMNSIMSKDGLGVPLLCRKCNKQITLETWAIKCMEHMGYDDYHATCLEKEKVEEGTSDVAKNS